MVVDGQYGYYVTDEYPWVLGCFSCAPDASFYRLRGGPRNSDSVLSWTQT